MWRDAVWSIVILGHRAHGRRPTLPHRHGMLLLMLQSHALTSVVHGIRRLSCHGVGSAWRRSATKDVMESSISLIGWASMLRGWPSCRIIAGLGGAIVCHAHSRDSKTGGLSRGHRVLEQGLFCFSPLFAIVNSASPPKLSALNKGDQYRQCEGGDV
jgi:hypothetical protein